MPFLSRGFLACLALALGLYWARPRAEWQNGVLLAASAGLLASFGGWSLAVLVGAMWVEQRLALAMEEAGPRRRRGLLAASVASNLGLLAFFKYGMPGVPAALARAGVGAGAWRVATPVGLSFWVLQKMTLALDVYYRRRPAERRLSRCLSFAGFFPTVVSGPIEGASRLLPQFDRARTFRPDRFAEGAWLFALGALQKAVLADNVAAVADGLLRPGRGGLAVACGAWAYAVQLYGDFAGYSYMARGCARLFGIELTQNFLAPYLRSNLSDYWRSWRVSLSGWLNEYVFTPVSLRLRHFGTAGVVAALWVTFVASGLWHGTGWAFFAYGCLHAFGLTVFTLTRSARKRLKARFGKARWLEAAAVLVTFQYVCLGYLFSRAPSLREAWRTVALLGRGPWSPGSVGAREWWALAPCAFAAFGLQWQVARAGDVF